MRNLLRVDGHDKLSKDAQTGGVVNTDVDGLNAARAAKRKLLESRNKIESLEDRVKKLESLIEQIIGVQ